MAITRLQLRKMDRISKLPSAIIETILCLVPIEEAARTSVLSKEWRYTWTKIPKLVFNEYMFAVKRTKQIHMMQVPSNFLTTIGEVLRMHDGTIDEFTLEMNTKGWYWDIACILISLSEKSVKKLKLILYRDCALPSSIFSWTHLTDLCLMGCRLYYEYHERTSGDSLGSLTTLYLKGLTGSTEDLVYFLSKCPSLKTLTFLPYLQMHYGIHNITYRTTIIDMFQCLQSIENLSISARYFECFSFVPGGPQKLPTVHLKYCRIEDMSFNTYNNIPMLGLLIISSPNLVRLVVELRDCYGKSECGYFKSEDYSDIWLEHLTELKIENMSDKKNAELDFAKLILARSCSLMKVNIVLYERVSKDVELQILEVLSSSLHASPTVEIVVERHPWDLYIRNTK